MWYRQLDSAAAGESREEKAPRPVGRRQLLLSRPWTGLQAFTVPPTLEPTHMLRDVRTLLRQRTVSASQLSMSFCDSAGTAFPVQAQPNSV